MKISFKKIASIVGGVLMVGSTVAAATLGGLPSNFVQDTQSNVAMIYGSSSASSDYTGATNLGNLVAMDVIENTPEAEVIAGEYDFSNAIGIEDEIPLGGDDIVYGKILRVLNDNKLPTLLDDKISWDDGNSTDDSFNVHEEILIGDLVLKTSLDDNEFKGVALTNDKGLTYRYVFEENMNVNLIGDEDADTLYITLLGERYEVESFDSSSITVITSKEKTFKKGDSYTVDGHTITIEGIGEDSIWVNGIIVDEDDTEYVNGLEIYVDGIFFSGAESMVNVRIGVDITTEFETGEAYPGEDEDEPNWVWDIDNPGQKDGFIGVTYDKKETSPDDNVLLPGDSLVLPNGYAALEFKSLTDVTYDDFKMKFIDDKDLWNSTSKYAIKNDVPVISIEGPNEDSFLVNGKETDTIYLRFAQAADGTEVNSAQGAVELFYEDINKDVSDSVRPRYVTRHDLNSQGNLNNVQVATLNVDDTAVKLMVKIVDGKATVQFVNELNTLNVKIGGDENLLAESGAFQWLGTNKEDAENDELMIDGVNIGTEDNDVMDYYGMIVETPESNCNDDEVLIRIPTKVVEAKISIVGKGSKVLNGNATPTTLPTGADYVFKDTAMSTVKDNNLIIVGGTCINAEAQKLLGTGALCGSDFTDKTGVSAGHALVQVFKSPYAEDKVAILVAGYNAEDTTAAINKIADGTLGIDLSVVGEKIII